MSLKPIIFGFCRVLTLAAICAPVPAMAGTWTVNIENDRIANTDRHYTNGFRIGWVSDARDENDFPELREALQFLYPLANVRRGRLGLGLGHNIYTPSDTDRRTLVTTDRPYAGWLYGTASLYAETSVDKNGGALETLDQMALELGVVGPAAHGKEVQNGFHNLINVSESYGWENQLNNEVGINLIGERKWRHTPLDLMGLEADAVPHVGATLGNVYTHANSGVTFRLGQKLNIDYGPPLIRPSAAGYGAVGKGDAFAWYAFAGVDGRAVLRNIFLDGNTFSDSHRVDRKVFVGDFMAGVAVIVGNARVAFTHVMRTREFEGQAETDRFGALSLSINF